MRGIVVYASVIVAFALGMASATSAEAAPTCKFPNCETTLTSGVKIKTQITPSVTDPEEWKVCTAGPMMIKGSETWLLTAGHCFAKTTEPVTAEYSAGGPKEIGKVTERIYSTKYDTGEVKVEQNPWTAALPAFISEWTGSGLGAAGIPAAVVGEATVTLREEVCGDGAVSGHRCGEIISLDATCCAGGVLTKDLVATSAEGAGGDSGGPVYKTAASEGLEVVGTIVGGGIGAQFSPGVGATVTAESNLLTELPEQTETEIKRIGKAIGKHPLVQVRTAGKGITLPEGTTVVKVEKGAKKGTVTVEMSQKAPLGGTNVPVWFGWKETTEYEPMAEIKKVKAYAGQELLTKITGSSRFTLAQDD
jgi:hypothetical protein